MAKLHMIEGKYNICVHYLITHWSAQDWEPQLKNWEQKTTYNPIFNQSDISYVPNGYV